jgi:hypothetical protein
MQLLPWRVSETVLASALLEFDLYLGVAQACPNERFDLQFSAAWKSMAIARNRALQVHLVHDTQILVLRRRKP